jgi:hypothetical protein
MNYYNLLRSDQLAEERRQDQNDRRIHQHFVGNLRPSRNQIIEKLRREANEYKKVQG